MPKIVSTADAHIERHQGSEMRLHECLAALRWVYDVARQRGISTVLVNGDMFHNRAQVSVPALHGAYTIARDGRRDGIKTIMVVGNHDMFYRNRRDVHSVAPFAELGQVVEQASTIDIDGVPVDIMPYHEEAERAGGVGCFTGEARVMFAHAAVSGAILNTRHGVVARAAGDVGDESVEEGTGVAMLTADELAHAHELVLLGHYHAAQAIKSAHARIEYIGSPIQLSFGEAEDPKRVCIVDLDTLAVESVWNTVSPGFVIIDSDGQALRDDDLKRVRNNRVRLIVPSGSNPVTVNNMRRQLINDGGAIWCERRDRALSGPRRTVVPISASSGEEAPPASAGAFAGLREVGTNLGRVIADHRALVEAYVDANPPEDVTIEEVRALGHEIVTQASATRRSQQRNDRVRKNRLKSIEITNFQSVGATVRLKFDDLGRCLIVCGQNLDVGGESNNGCGKSTVFIEAPYWCLFGETRKQLKKSEIPNDQLGKKCSVRVHVNDLIVTRSIKPDRLEVKNAVTGVDETRSTKDATQAFLNEELGLHDETFSFLSFYDSESMFEFLNVSEAQRRTMIESMSSLELQAYLDDTRRRKASARTRIATLTAQSSAHAEELDRRIKPELERLRSDDLRRRRQLLAERERIEARLAQFVNFNADACYRSLEVYESLVNEAAIARREHANRQLALESAEAQASADLEALDAARRDFESCQALIDLLGGVPLASAVKISADFKAADSQLASHRAIAQQARAHAENMRSQVTAQRERDAQAAQVLASVKALDDKWAPIGIDLACADAVQTNVIGLQRELAAENSSLSNVQRDADAARRHRAQIEQSIATLQAAIEQLRSAERPSCAVCGSALSDDSRARQIADYTAQVDQANARIAEIDACLATYSEAQAAIEQRIARLNAQLAEPRHQRIAEAVADARQRDRLLSQHALFVAQPRIDEAACEAQASAAEADAVAHEAEIAKYEQMLAGPRLAYVDRIDEIQAAAAKREVYLAAWNAADVRWREADAAVARARAAAADALAVADAQDARAQAAAPAYTRDQVIAWDREYTQLRHDIDNIAQQEQDQTMLDLIERLEIRKDEVEQQIAAAAKEISQEQRNERMLAYWESAFAVRIRDFLFGEIIGAINESVSRWLFDVFGGDVEMRFDSKFEATITMRSTGQETSYRRLSAGERRRLNLAILLGFGEVMQAALGVDTDYMVFDEPVDKLDGQGILGAADAFARLAANGKRVVVITHHPGLHAALGWAQSISVVKENGFTRVNVPSTGGVRDDDADGDAA